MAAFGKSPEQKTSTRNTFRGEYVLQCDSREAAAPDDRFDFLEEALQLVELGDSASAPAPVSASTSVSAPSPAEASSPGHEERVEEAREEGAGAAAAMLHPAVARHALPHHHHHLTAHYHNQVSAGLWGCDGIASRCDAMVDPIPDTALGVRWETLTRMRIIEIPTCVNRDSPRPRIVSLPATLVTEATPARRSPRHASIAHHRHRRCSRDKLLTKVEIIAHCAAGDNCKGSDELNTVKPQHIVNHPTVSSRPPTNFIQIEGLVLKAFPSSPPPSMLWRRTAASC
ncbi:hypothetical protein EVAR_22319_1 [Eumeta japonica]|uniref:Uncharacterized protein n=1 Tax=Eumeta variegata TaxID=151549 RepID=A0A4C1UAW4_EUMVA|nr:hypothetical protein EVAR_22319_1 [Eumeta japonica]